MKDTPGRSSRVPAVRPFAYAVSASGLSPCLAAERKTDDFKLQDVSHQID
jgi:hypothetical protein